MSFPESHNNNNQNNNNNMTTDSRRNWWRQSVGRRTVSFVQNDIQQVVSQSPFLQQASASAVSADTATSTIALFHRSEIITGERLGKGGFSDVYEITALDLNHDFVSTRLTPQQCQLRLQYQRSIAAASSSGCRYVIKQLQEQLLSNPKQFQVAASDLAVEAAYMSSLDHVNILKARGLPVDGLEALADGRHDGYFIILDRLEGTLDQRIEEWKQLATAAAPGQEATDNASSVLLEKADYALQLARAVAYLHERRIIFRDVKSANVGFTADGTIKLLDFGLCRQLPTGQQYYNQEKDEEEVFTMSGVGTRRYMAVEIINSARYNEKADVYSWSMLFWEMLFLQKPYQTYTVEEHRVLVCQNGQRPPLHSNNKSVLLPMSIQNLLQQTWCESIPQRLSMQQAHNVLQDILNSSFCMGGRQQQLQAPASPVGVCDSNFMMMMDHHEPYSKQLLLLPMTAHLQLPYVSMTTTADDDDDDDYDDDYAEHDFLQDHRMSSDLSEQGGVEEVAASDICSLLLDDDSLLGGGNHDDMFFACPNDAQYHHYHHPQLQQQQQQQQVCYHHHREDAYYYDYAMQYNIAPRREEQRCCSKNCLI